MFLFDGLVHSKPCGLKHTLECSLMVMHAFGLMAI
jgi:hypothetical protein